MRFRKRPVQFSEAPDSRELLQPSRLMRFWIALRKCRKRIARRTASSARRRMQDSESNPSHLRLPSKSEARPMIAKASRLQSARETEALLQVHAGMEGILQELSFSGNRLQEDQQVAAGTAIAKVAKPIWSISPQCSNSFVHKP